MRAVIQRVKYAEVTVAGTTAGRIDSGLMVLLGIHREDAMEDVSWMAEKLVHLRIFEDSEGRMNRSLMETGGEMLLVSQFTLVGDCRKGRRPSWSSAASPDIAEKLYQEVVDAVGKFGVKTATGVFQAMMDVHMTNHGPVTLLLDSHKRF